MPDRAGQGPSQRETRGQEVELLRKYQAALDADKLESMSLSELRSVAEMLKLTPSHEPGFLEKTGKLADKFGVPELAGGALGSAFGPMGTIAGAGLARGATEVGKNMLGLQDKDAGEIWGDTLTSGTFAAAPLAAGRAASNIGKGTMRASLPITEEMAESAGGRNAMHRGVDQIVENVLKSPGMTPRSAYSAVEKKLSSAKLQELNSKLSAMAQGRKVDPNVVASKAMDRINAEVRGGIHSPGQVSGSEAVVDEFLDNAGRSTRKIPLDLGKGEIGGGTRTIPAPPMEADRARGVLNLTPYQTGSAEIAGTKEGVRAVRRALSDEYKGILDDAGKQAMAKQAESYPLLEVIDKALTKGGTAAQGEILLSGFKPKVFGMLSPTGAAKFTTGKILNRTGDILQGNNTLGKVILPRGNPAATGELLNYLTQLLASEGDE
jgi:hypothetical protein